MAGLERVADSVAMTSPAPNVSFSTTFAAVTKGNTRADYELRTQDPVQLVLGGDMVDFGTGNLCANCHMSRAISPMPAVGGPDVNVTSSRYGGHHSPVANIMGGTGLLHAGSGGVLPGDLNG